MMSGIFENGLDQGEQHERVIRRLRIHERNRFEQIQRQHLIHREIILQLDVHAQLASRAALGRIPGHPARVVSPPAVALRGLMNSTILRSSSERNNCQARCVCAFFGLGRFVAIADELLHRGATVAFAAQHIQQHPVRHLKARGQSFRAARR